MSKEYKLNIFDVLSKANDGDAGYFKTLNETERKALSFWLVLMWGWGTSVEGGSLYHIFMAHEMLNKNMGLASKHPNLLWGLVCATLEGMPNRYKFPKKKNKLVSQTVLENLLVEYYGISGREAIDYIPLHTKEDFVGIAERLGYTDDQMKKLEKVL